MIQLRAASRFDAIIKVIIPSLQVLLKRFKVPFDRLWRQQLRLFALLYAGLRTPVWSFSGLFRHSL